MASKHIKKCSISVATTRKMQTKTTMRSHHGPTRMAKRKSEPTESRWHGGRLEPVHTAAGAVDAVSLWMFGCIYLGAPRVLGKFYIICVAVTWVSLFCENSPSDTLMISTLS